MNESLSIVLPTFNERENLPPLLNQIFYLLKEYNLEILIVDDNSTDGTIDLVKKLANQDSRIRLIRRLGRSGLASAIKEGLLDATGNIAVVMDSDGQHQPSDVINALQKLTEGDLDVVAGSRFASQSEILGLSNRRKEGSTLANYFSGISLPFNYRGLTDYMTGCFVLNLDKTMETICKVDVNGFKFFYELLAVSKGRLNVSEVPLTFQPRLHGKSKLELAVLWDFLISFLHTISFRIMPRRAISFALVGASGVFVQLSATSILTNFFYYKFENILPFSVLVAATSNYLINNALTFRARRQTGLLLLKGLFKFLLVASLPVIANISIAMAFYTNQPDPLLAQIAGIFFGLMWNYIASSKFVWNTP
tara:strand:+ start:238 stop:1332 length:1095 start_codon:yes stop_codon:yes gene_type:complete